MPFEMRGGMADRALLRAQEALRRARAYRARGGLDASVRRCAPESLRFRPARRRAALGARMCFYWKRKGAMRDEEGNEN